MSLFHPRIGYNRRQRILKRIAKVQHAFYMLWRWTYRRGIFYAVALFGLGFGIEQGRDQLPELNPLRWKNVKTFEVSGNNMVTFEDVLRIAVLDTGMLLKDINVEQVKERLLAEPWISSVTTSEKFPSTFRIDIQESTPIMSSLDAGRWVVYSERGVVLPLSTQSAYAYPIVDVSTRESREVCARFLFTMLKEAPELYKKVSLVTVAPEERAVEVFFNDVRFKTLFLMDGGWSKNVFAQYHKMMRNYSESMVDVSVLDLRFEGFAYLRNLGSRRKNG